MSSGADILAWFDTDEARRTAERLAARRGLSGYDALHENVLADARVAVWKRMQSPSPLDVANPAAYGTDVIRSVLRQTSQGRADVSRFEPADIAIADADAIDPTVGDDLRLLVEHDGDQRGWLTAAVLSYLTLLLHPGAVPEAAPRPRAGSTPDQARCWPALWYAGEHDIFDEPYDKRGANHVRRARARRIDAVLQRFAMAVAGYRLGQKTSDG